MQTLFTTSDVLTRNTTEVEKTNITNSQSVKK